MPYFFYGFISIKGERVMSKILIIDDDLEICSLVKRALEKEGHQVGGGKRRGFVIGCFFEPIVLSFFSYKILPFSLL